MNLSKYTTLGTGGPARDFAQPSSIGELEELLRRGENVAVVGLGSNLLVADEGVDALVLHLEGDLAAVARSSSVCGPAEARPTRSRCTVRATRGSADSNSRARFPARSAVGSG